MVCAFNAMACAEMIYNFDIFNNPAYENDSRLSFTMTVSDEGLNYDGRQKAGFTFNNNSTASSSITDIYFDSRPGDSALNFHYVSSIEGPGVNFSKNASPKSLPGGQELFPTFDKTPEYSVDSDRPVSHNGINPNEWLKLVFTLNYNKTIDDIILEISNGSSSSLQSLRVGIRIQSLPGPCDDSASAINCTEPIPEPASAAVLALGLVIMLRKNNKAAAFIA